MSGITKPNVDLMVDGSPLTRRGFLKYVGAVAGSAIIPGGVFAEGDKQVAPEAFRFVHLADIHVQKELGGDRGFQQCLKVIHELKPRPEFILTGGDQVMDVSNVSEARAKELFDLYTGIRKDSDIPFRECIGNHDVFGWHPASKIKKDHPLYGKKMVQERLDLPKTTYSFDHKGWHFCVVDTIHRNGFRFALADLDWLGRDLKAVGDRPKVVCSHVPVVSASAFRDWDYDEHRHRSPLGRVCRNPGAILRLFREHRVTLALVGHTHQNERIEYNGTVHIGEGAVSGNKWKGPRHGHPEGFGVIDVRADGTFEHRYQTFGWQSEYRPISDET